MMDEQSSTEQKRTEQNRTEQNRTQNNITQHNTTWNLVYQLIRPSLKTKLFPQFSQVNIFSSTVICFDSCPHQMVSIPQLKNRTEQDLGIQCRSLGFKFVIFEEKCH